MGNWKDNISFVLVEPKEPGNRGKRKLEVRIMRNLKHLIGRSGLTDWELRMLHGICSQIEKRLRD
ncbi:MAG: hypothetical protein FJ243_04565 [Nitrospira sp.]|nr:hypothetical protein [Nitrospira sp.]